MNKYLAIGAILMTGIYMPSYAQFTASISNVDNKLVFKLKPTTNTNAEFSTVEFFVRYPAASPAFTYGDIIENTTNFPGIQNFSVEPDVTPEATAGGYKVDHFIYTAPSTITTSKDYVAGTEYEIFSVDLIGDGKVNFELVHSESYSPFYLAITDGEGQDIAVTDPAAYFFPATRATGTAPARLFAQSLNDVPLPVNFLSFYTVKSGDAAKLTWTVENDLKNAYFEIQRSADGRQFTTISRVNALGNGRSTNSYETADAAFATAGNVSYYRIKQVDIDGTTTYSAIRNLNVDRKLALSLFPNPARTTSKLVFDAAAAGKATLSVRDAAGRQVQVNNFQIVKGVNQQTINVQNLPAGEYNVTLLGAGFNETIKLSKAN